MRKNFKFHAIATTVIATTLVTACGGGSDDVPIASDACQVLSTSGGSVTVGSGVAGDPALPEAASGYRTGLKPVYSRNIMVTSSNALASVAGCSVLKKGGSAADAAVAVQAVLGLTVPEATGLGSGGFMLYYNKASGTVQSYDGRESAPAAATANYLRYIDDNTNKTTPMPSARASGRSIGTIGIPRLLEAVHKDHGLTAWKDLFGDAINLSTNGFQIGGRLAAAISSNATSLKRDPEATAYFFNADGTPKALGTVLKNPAYAQTLTNMAANGAGVMYSGQIAADIVAKIGATTATDGSAITPGKTTLADLAAYQVKRREPVCTTYRATYWICGMPPPTSGGIAVASAMGVLENFNLAQYAPTAIDGEGGKPTVLGVHLISEAERLAYADRDKYVADTDYVPLPGGTWDTMLNKPYLKSRASLIKLTASMGTATAGDLGAIPLGVDTTIEHGTNHFTIVDAFGDVLTATTTVESSMGSFHMTNGFLLNNQLTDFSASPTDASGALVANRLAPGKRPRSSMAPTLVFKINVVGGKGDFVMATGSPGGGTIIQYVVKTLVGSLDWGLNAQQSSGLVDFGASNGPTTTVGGEHPNVNITNNGNNDPLITGLRSLGHTVSTAAQASGVNTIMRATVNGSAVWQGGTDPRREGLVLGDAFTP
ncbi:gamma-glutamyltransferase [Rhodoferax koreense]|uniref:Gamma-glutamyltransferase n=1 Tax=Rhodoferax koreensis TaxID=1842727 RepID=A0A1P8JSL9_9BURK|nr:gamma-glutamyltransferase family protein [Rhodoferax koreense]APW36764.1 gamma-glutamyltransferase [Rhodoferax koreense]